MLIVEPGDRVVHADGTVISKPADMTDQVRSPVVDSVVVEPGSGIKTSDATIVMATYNPQRWPFIEATSRAFCPEKTGHGMWSFVWIRTRNCISR